MADLTSDSAANNPEDKKETANSELSQHHVSKILDQILEEDEEPTSGSGRFKYPIVIDILLTFSLLVIMSAFSFGLLKMYVGHSARQCINQHNYTAAISLLARNPLPKIFSTPGINQDELLAEALYMDAVTKLDKDNDVKTALEELQQIPAGSRYFALAQEIITEHFVPASTMLQGGAETIETNPPKPEPKLLPDDSESNN